MLNLFRAALVIAAACIFAGTVLANDTATRYGYEEVDEVKIFYREAGNPKKPAIVLLHGFPTSSHMYREVLAALSDAYYLIAPDYPGFGNSGYPSIDEYTYTFDNIALTMNKFLEQRGVDQYSLMIQDYGAPIGFRIATAHPERIQTIITQNGNAYEEGISKEGWGPILDFWQTRTPELEQEITKNAFSLEGLEWQYTHGTRNPSGILPDNWVMDYANLSRPGQHRIQLDLFYDYQNNLKLYPTWQAYLSKHQPPVLVVWGEHDAFFPEPGAKGYQRDVEDVDYNILNTGHFALEEEHVFITNKIREFLTKRGIN